MKRGFTLIETLVVATIFSIIGVSLTVSLSAGLKIWSRAQKQALGASGLALTVETVAKDLRQSVYIKPIGYEGKAKEISFLAFSGDRVYKITYSLDYMRHGLARRQQDLASSLSEDLQGKFSEKTIYGVEDFSLRYLFFDKEKQEYGWKDSWEKEEGVIPAVEIKAKFKNDECSKIVFIPAA